MFLKSSCTDARGHAKVRGRYVKTNPDTRLAAELPEYKSRCNPTCSSVSPSSECRHNSSNLVSACRLALVKATDPKGACQIVVLGLWHLSLRFPQKSLATLGAMLRGTHTRKLKSMLFVVSSTFDRFPAKLGPKTPPDGPVSKTGAERASNQPRKPIQM
jgi:hypothetical protein